ncbi:unnamed protein product [Paramecium octaurelia]|uniref:Uncharacterized protein n=1 Tax=Paramecium octaurelia TaxID=43137 RepID=A0A8S1Y6A1_PAROT|nr:unnamed protein product [Paramecium octaurelia]
MQKHQILSINTPRDVTCPIEYQSRFRKQNDAATLNLSTISDEQQIIRRTMINNIKNKVFREVFLIVTQKQ